MNLKKMFSDIINSSMQKAKIEYNEFIQNAKRNSLYETGVDAEYGDSLITLSTCSYHVENGRFAVIGREK